MARKQSNEPWGFYKVMIGLMVILGLLALADTYVKGRVVDAEERRAKEVKEGSSAPVGLRKAEEKQMTHRELMQKIYAQYDAAEDAVFPEVMTPVREWEASGEEDYAVLYSLAAKRAVK
jgi:hypothetical protein